jgi:hypothetical protein
MNDLFVNAFYTELEKIANELMGYPDDTPEQTAKRKAARKAKDDEDSTHKSIADKVKEAKHQQLKEKIKNTEA